MIRLYRLWENYRREMAALERIVAILKDQDAHLKQSFAELERIMIESTNERKHDTTNTP